jgi:hypothetical protein
MIQVKITDMQISGASRELLAGDPQCAPVPVLVSEGYIHLIRTLHGSKNWTSQVCSHTVKYMNKTF